MLTEKKGVIGQCSGKILCFSNLQIFIVYIYTKKSSRLAHSNVVVTDTYTYFKFKQIKLNKVQ